MFKNIKVRRPLALFCLLFLFSVCFLLRALPYEDEALPWTDGEEALLCGRLARKEFRVDGEGRQGFIWYVDAQEEGLYVQCYMDGAAPGEAETSVGAQVAVRGRIRHFSEATNPGEFDAASYYRTIGIACRMTGARLIAENGARDVVREGLFRIRCVLAASLDACLSAEDAGVMRAMLLGDKSALDGETKKLYRQSGIIHILAISGLHISLIGMGMFSLLVRLRCPRLHAVGVCIPVMLAYGEMCGQTPSAVRAILMFLIRLVAILTGRSYDILTALAVAAVFLLVEQPLYITYSGFLLSFLSVLAIGAFLPALAPLAVSAYAPARGDPPWKPLAMRILSGVLASLSVSLVTLPVYMLFFHTVPIYAVLLNVLILPLMSAVVGAGILCMSAGLLAASAGTVIGLADHLLLALFRALCLAENAMPGAVWVTGHANGTQVAVYYGMLTIFVLWVSWAREKAQRRRPGSDRRKRRAAIRTAAPRLCWLVCALLILSARSVPALRIAVLDVGQGDGIVIEGAGLAILIDGGSTSRTDVGEYVLSSYLAYEGIDHLDAAVVTHEDEDHINGVLALLEDETDALTVGYLVLPDIAEESRGENYRKLLEVAKEHGVPVSFLACGDALVRGELSIQCLGPAPGMSTGEPNETSTILYLTYGDFSALFTGDVEGRGEEALLSTLAAEPEIARNLTFLKVAHHGSRYTTGEAMLARLSPRIAAISCARNSRYGHPHEELLARLAAVGAETFVTARQGAVFVETDGRMVRAYGYLEKTE